MQRLFSIVNDTGKLNFFRKTAGLYKIFWLALTVFDWFWVLLFESKSPLKKILQLGHSYETFMYLFGRNTCIYIRLLPANKNYPLDILKLVIKGNFGLLCDSGVQTIHLLLNFLVEYWINLNYL